MKNNQDSNETFNYYGTWLPCLRVNWTCHKAGFIVQRHTVTGHISGHLTDRGGFGNPYLAQLFPTAEAATTAATRKGLRLFTILHNQPNLGQFTAKAQNNP